MTLPRRNLPGAAENWGRAVEDALDDIDSRISDLRETVQTRSRSFAGSLAVTSSQVREIYSRRVDVSRIGDLSFSAPTTPALVTSRTVSIPRPEYNLGLSEYPARRALVSFSAQVQGQNIDTFYNSYFELYQEDGAGLIWRGGTGLGATGSAPAEWVNSGSVYCVVPVTLPASSNSSNFLVQFGGWRLGNSPTLSFSNITLSLSYSGVTP